MIKKVYLALISLVALLLAAACTDDLDQKPVIGDSADKVYSTIEGYKSVLAKIYGSYSLIGQERAGNPDLSSNKGQDLLRNLFNMQEAATDEVANTWLSGENLSALTYMNWDASDVWVADTYYRLYYSIALCNEFLRYTGEGSIGGFSDAEKELIRTYAAEARFIRALDYWFVLDLFRQGPYVDQDTPTTGVIPPAYDGKQLYDYIMSEITELETLLPDTNYYGQADKAALWALAIRLTLNAEIYTGSAAYTECVGYANKIINTGRYSLEPEYQKLFNADNHLRTNEIIFAFSADADQATTWGSATNIICSSCGNNSTQDPAKYGIESGWGNWRVRGELPALFDAADGRRLFWEDGQTQYFTDGITTDSQGFFSEKWTNLTDAGQAASASAARGCSTDYPMFRLAEVYLSAAEAVLRGGSGMSRQQALDLVNAVRERGYGDASGRISDAQFNLPFMLDERGRELYHEMHRRTDLVRFGRFTTDAYVWQWKGANIDPKYSDVQVVSITPYFIDMSVGFVLDASQNDTGRTLYSPASDGIYSGFIGAGSWENWWLREGNNTVWGNDGVTGTAFVMGNNTTGLDVWNFWYPSPSGCYYTVVNTRTNEWSALYIGELNLGGDLTGAMTYDRKANKWTYTFDAAAGTINVTLSANGKQYNTGTGTDDAAAVDTPVAFGGVAGNVTFGQAAQAISVEVAAAGETTLTLDLSDPRAWTLTADAGSAGPVETVPPVIYLSGVQPDWDFSNYLKLYNEDNRTYGGALQVNSEWGYRIYTEAEAWDNYWTMVDGGTAFSGQLVNNGEGNIAAPEAGFYLFDVNMGDLTYKLTPVTKVSYTGLNDDWSLTEMTATGEPGVYTAQFEKTANTPWGVKIVLNDNWDLFFGGNGTRGELVLYRDGFEGDNELSNGTHTLTVNLSKGTYSYE